MTHAAAPSVRDSGFDLDLEPTAARYDRASLRPRRVLLAVIVAFGGASLLLGLVLSFPSGTLGTARPLLALGGIGVTIAGAWGWTRVPSSATRVKADSEAIEFWTATRPAVRLRWADRSTRLTLRDWTSIPVSSRPRGMKDIEFIVATNPPIEAPLPPGAAEYVLARAKDHDMTLVGWRDHPPPVGVERVIQIRNRL